MMPPVRSATFAEKLDSLEYFASRDDGGLSPGRRSSNADKMDSPVSLRNDGGHGNLPVGGHRKSPLMAASSPHGWPRISPLLLS